jgi:N-methylhydantoinase B
VQRGAHAIALASGALLAVAPDHWTDGCPTIEELRHSSSGRTWLQRTYLDPSSGRALAVEAVPPGAPRSFASAPRHWTDAASARTP